MLAVIIGMLLLSGADVQQVGFALIILGGIKAILQLALHLAKFMAKNDNPENY